MFLLTSIRASASPGLSLVSAIALGILTVQAAHAASKRPWHLAADCSTCLRMADAWQRYGTGHPDIAVMVAEPRIFADTRAAASWHAGVAGRRFELLVAHGDPDVIDPVSRPRRSLVYQRNNQEQGLAILDRITGRRDRPALRLIRPRWDTWELCSFVRQDLPEGARNHDLQMASLIGGRQYLGTSGVAPDTHVVLAEATIAPERADLLKELLARRPEIRVVNFSQGHGRVSDDIAIESAPSHGLHYRRLDRLVMELSVAGMLETRAQSATRFLVVASAGNVPAFASNIVEPEEVLDPRIPPEAVHLAQPTPEYIDLRPHYLRDMPHLDLPLIVVGAIGPDGTLPSYGRVDQGIDIYAPAGLDWLAQARRATPTNPSLGGAEWRECICAQLATDHLRAESRPASTYGDACAALTKPEHWFELGIPALDFHTHAIELDATSSPLRAHCAEQPGGLCTSLAHGTSAAAALVSGVAALMFALDPTQSGEEAAKILKSTARRDNPLKLPVVDAERALDAVVHRIGARLFGAIADPKQLVEFFGEPFYYTWLDHPEAYVFASRRRAAQFVAEAFTWLGPADTRRLTAVRRGRVQRCGIGMAGSTVGIQRSLEGQDACAEAEDGVEILRFELDFRAGPRDLVADVILRRASRLGPDVHWRVAGLAVGRN